MAGSGPQQVLRTAVALLALLQASVQSADLSLNVREHVRAKQQAAGVRDEWFCECRHSVDAAQAFDVDDGVFLVPGLGNSKCEVPPEGRECKPVEGTMPGLKGCTLGELDVSLPTEYRVPNMSSAALNPGHVEWMWDVLLTYREHMCQPGHYLAGEGLRVSCDPNVLELQENKTLRVQGRMLDYGADFTGRQLQFLSQYVEGQVVGYNVKSPGWRPLTQYLEAPGNYSYVFGEEGTCLPFRDDTFDFVYSINVLEHAMPFQRYLSEAVRVLRPGGMLYLQTHPNWWSARGHHVHIDLVWSWARALEKKKGPQEHCRDDEVKYSNDGSFIPDWSHLLWSRQEMESHLNGTRLGQCPPLLELVLGYMYDDQGPHSSGLNKAHLSEYSAFLHALGLTQVRQRFWTSGVTHLSHAIAERLAEKYGHSDFLLAGAEYWFVKPTAAAAHDGSSAVLAAAAEATAAVKDAAEQHKQQQQDHPPADTLQPAAVQESQPRLEEAVAAQEQGQQQEELQHQGHQPEHERNPELQRLKRRYKH